MTWVRSRSLASLVAFLAGCAADDGAGSLSADPDRPQPEDPGSADVSMGNEGEPCGEVGVIRELPQTGTRYCVAANDECMEEGGSCPLLVALHFDHRFFRYLSDPDEPPFIAVESYQQFDGDAVKDALAALPGEIARDFPGLDPERIYAAGWSAGAGGVTRGLCQSSKGYDESEFGTTSDVYAAMVAVGGCVSCSGNFMPLSGNAHVFATNGSEDQFAGGGCYESLAEIAEINGCSDLAPGWCDVVPGDALVPNAPGNDRVRRLSFGECERGDVEAYVFVDEGHDITYKRHVDPRVRSYDMVWQWLKGRTKSEGTGYQGPVGTCQ